jgi:hypothetical protein
MAVRKETIKKQLDEALPSMLEPGEKVEAGVNTIVGPSPWLSTGLLGLIGQFLIKYYYVVVTDRRVLFVRMSRLSMRPLDLASAAPLSSVSVTQYKPASLWSVLKIDTGAGKEMRLNVHRIWRDELEPVAAALGATAPSA